MSCVSTMLQLYEYYAINENAQSLLTENVMLGWETNIMSVDDEFKNSDNIRDTPET